MDYRHKLLPYVLLLPAIIGIAVFSFYPFIINVINSFMAGTTQAGNLRFVGFDNYRYVLRDRILIKSLVNTVNWTFTVTIFQFLVGFGLALFCTSKLKIMKLVKPLYILPWAIPGVVATLAWRWMYNGDYGIINSMLFQLGLIKANIGWISNPSLAMMSVIIVGVWKGFPFYLLMTFAGLQTIPGELFEAAKIDGANQRQSFWHITLPQMKVVLTMALTLGFIWTSNYYDGIYALTGGGPARSTETLPIYIYNTAFSYYRMNDAVIPSIILFIFAASLGAVYLKLKTKGDEL